MENNNLYTSSRNDVEPTPILKKHSISESSRDDMAPKSILKKKSSFEDSSRHEKVIHLNNSDDGRKRVLKNFAPQYSGSSFFSF